MKIKKCDYNSFVSANCGFPTEGVGEPVFVLALLMWRQIIWSIKFNRIWYLQGSQTVYLVLFFIEAVA